MFCTIYKKCFILVNAKKSNVLLVSNKPLATVDFRVSLCNLPIPVNEEVKLLGVFSRL